MRVFGIMKAWCCHVVHGQTHTCAWDTLSELSLHFKLWYSYDNKSFYLQHCISMHRDIECATWIWCFCMSSAYLCACTERTQWHINNGDYCAFIIGL